MLSVKELRTLAASMAPTVFLRQLGPFALIQRPPEEKAQQASLVLGAKRTVAVNTAAMNVKQKDLFEYDDLVVATLPPLKEAEELIVGRLPDCELVIDDPSVSKHHAALRWDSRTHRCFLTDLGSTNGTRLNGEGLWEPEVVLRDWDQVTFGEAPFWFVHAEALHRRLATLAPLPG